MNLRCGVLHVPCHFASATTFVSDHVGLHHEPERPDPALDGVAHPLKKLKTEHHRHAYPNGTSNGNGTSDWPAYDTAAGTLTPPPTLGPVPLAPPPASLGAPAPDTVVAPASPRSTTSSVHGGAAGAPRRSPPLPPAPSLPVSPSHHLPAAAAPSPPPSASLAETPVLPMLSPSSARHGANDAAAANMDMDVDDDDAGDRVPNGHRRGSTASDSSARPPPATAFPPYASHDSNGPAGYDSPHAIPVGIYSPFTALSSRGSSPDVSAAVSVKSEPGVPVAPTPAVPAALTAPPPVAAVPSAAAAAGVASVPRDTDKPMSMAQFKHALSMLRAIKRLKDAHIFLDPVDPVKLNIPDYPLIITHPMDLSTMERKLTTRAYATIDQLVADFNLMLDNCIKYNGPQSVFATMANNVRRSFERHFEKMPSVTRPQPHVPSPVPARLAATAAAGATASKSSSALANKTPRSSKASSSGASGSGGARRPSMTAATAKGESLSSAASGSRASKAASAASVRRAAEELKFCQSLIRELFRKHYNDFTNPFLQPVDRKMYPSYFEVVKHPIDLSTIRKRLDDGYYANAAGFEADMQLMFHNCYQFNPIGTPVRIMGQKLEALFKRKWSERPQAQSLAQSSANSSAASSSSALPLPAAPSSSVRTAAPSSSPATAPAASASRAKQSARSRTKPAASKAAAAALDSDSSDDDDDKLAIAQLEDSVKRMQQQIEQMRARRLEKKRRRREARAREQQQLEQMQRAQMQKEQAYARTAPTSYQHPGYKGGTGSGADAPSAAPIAAARRSAGARGGAASAAAKKSAAGRHGAGSARGGYAASSSAAAAAAPAAPVEPVVEITYEMKRELSERINDLSAEKLQQVLTIIQESMPSLSDGQEEIELDISSLDHRTLYRLWQLVTEDAQSASSAAANPAAQQQQDPPLPPLHHLAAQGGSLSSAASSSANSSTHSLPSVASAASAPLPPLHKASGPTALSSMLGTNSSDDDGSDDESSGSDSD
ncbi:hypothetical protein GGF32_005390 [Allomyces javanicus]|nr:hypothetical protein GGF32_005390 [Allomyces javanicus]